jgi:L(+)-tartrate dehydratase alpha subunit
MDQTLKKEELIDLVAKFTAYSSKHLPDDVFAKLETLRAQENLPLAKAIYDIMFKNLEVAGALDRPCCQDTGVIQYFVQVGTEFPLINEIEDCLRLALKKTTQETPLRHNVVEIFDENNTGTNIGTRIPWIEWDLIPYSNSLWLYVYMAGGGCSLPGVAKVLMPLDGYEGAVKFVFDQVTSYGINACPPLLIGIGIAGSVEVAAKLSKKALLRFIGSHNSNSRGEELEKRIEKGLNDLKIGPGGFTGRNSVMGVNIEQAGRHPSTLAVGLSTGCWAHRRALIKIEADMKYEMISHKMVKL